MTSPDTTPLTLEAPRETRFEKENTEFDGDAAGSERGSLGQYQTPQAELHNLRTLKARRDRTRVHQLDRGNRDCRGYGLADRTTVYRHAHAFGLFAKRQRNVRATLEKIIEKFGEVEVISGTLTPQGLATRLPQCRTANPCASCVLNCERIVSSLQMGSAGTKINAACAGVWARGASLRNGPLHQPAVTLDYVGTYRKRGACAAAIFTHFDTQAVHLSFEIETSP